MAQEALNHIQGPPAWAALLSRTLDRLHEQFAALAALSAHQGPLVEADDPEPLLSLLGERQGIIDQIAVANRDLEPLRSKWEVGAAQLPVCLRDQIRSRIDRIAELAGDVARRDESDQARLVRRRDEVVDRLAEIGRARGALAAYGARPCPGGASFQDAEA